MTFVQVIIIDEVTMISDKVLSAIDFGLRKIMKQKNSGCGLRPFGGKSILLFGDVAQVPAVTSAKDDFIEALRQFNESEPYINLIQWKLNQIMRQSEEEQSFNKLLENIRKHDDGSPFSEDIELLLKQRFIPGNMDEVIVKIDESLQYDNENRMVITFLNKIALYYNNYILIKRSNMNNNVRINLQAKFCVREKSAFLGQFDEYDRKQAQPASLRLATQGEIETLCGAIKKRYVNSIIPFSLNIITGARVILFQNIDISSGLINGTRGKMIEYIAQIDVISVKFDHQSENEQPILIARRKSVEHQIADGKVIFMYQFHLKLSWAVTAHKSQGQTLGNVAIYIDEKAFAHGSSYVALSRVKKLNNVVLFGLEEWKIGGPDYHMNVYIQAKGNEQTENIV